MEKRDREGGAERKDASKYANKTETQENKVYDLHEKREK